MKVRFIVEIVSSASDRNGNRSHFADITSTMTGKRLRVSDLGGPSNVRYLFSRLLGRSFDINYPNVYTIEQTVPLRQWQAAAKGQGIYESQVSEATIRELEKD